jgi:hypothetical protein
MAQGNFHGVENSITRIKSGQVRVSEQTSIAGSLRVVPSVPANLPAGQLLAGAVVAASRKSGDASKLLGLYADGAAPVQATLARLVRPNAAPATSKTIAAALYSSQTLEPAAAEKFLTRLGLHLISVEPDAALDQAMADRLLVLAGINGAGTSQQRAAAALANDEAYRAEFQSCVVATAVQAGALVQSQQPECSSLRSRVGYTGPRQPRRSSHRRPRAVIRAAERVLQSETQVITGYTMAHKDC